jgi:hypothetical protein
VVAAALQRISSINAISALCEASGADVQQVRSEHLWQLLLIVNASSINLALLLSDDLRLPMPSALTLVLAPSS